MRGNVRIPRASSGRKQDLGALDLAHGSIAAGEHAVQLFALGLA